MNNTDISHSDHYERRRVVVLDIEMAYVDTGTGDPIVFLHGNPTSSYIWRNIIPHVEELGRCLAPDLVGMGDSGKAPKGSYRFVDHVRYLDTWFDMIGITNNVTLVGHDWGSALGFYWAYRHPSQVKGIVYMEAIVQPLTWEAWPEPLWLLFKAVRSPIGEEMILQKNWWVRRTFPTTMLRRLTEEEMEVYDRPYLKPGESRRPTLTWTRELPLDGEPTDVAEIVELYSKWLATSDVPKLFINADPGSLLVGEPREFCRMWPNQQEVTVKGIHSIQEDSPVEIGQAIASFLKQIAKQS